MIEQIDGDIFKGEWEAMAHQVNTYGVMGKGIAKIVKKLYPNNFYSYSRQCVRIIPEALHGKIIAHKEKSVYILNCFSQIGWKTDYNLVDDVVAKMKKYCMMNNIKTLAIPYNYGCGLGGGNWDIVYDIFKSYFEGSDIILRIYKI